VTDRGAFDRQPLSCALASMNSSALDIAKLLVEKYGADIHDKDDSGAAPIHIACLNTSELYLAEYLLDRGANIEETDNDGMTPFLTACGFAGKGLEIAKPLAKRGANISKVDKKGNTALHLACKSPTGKVDLVKWLVKQGIYDLNARNSAGRTPIMIAAGSGASWDSPAVIEYLLHKVRTNSDDS
jgi:ankyrin repeat protein